MAKEEKVTLTTLFPEGVPEVLSAPIQAGLQKPTVDRITMSCCGLIIWKRVDKHGNCVQSFGWTINADSMTCIGCSYNKKLKKEKENLEKTEQNAKSITN